MNKKLKVTTWIVFLIAFFAPLWSVSIAFHGLDSETQQYSGIQAAAMGFCNLALVLPSFIFLLLGGRKEVFYVVSIVLSVISIVAMCIWAFGGAA